MELPNIAQPTGTLPGAATGLGSGLQFFRFGLAAAQAMILFVLVLVLTGLQFTVFERWVTYQ